MRQVGCAALLGFTWLNYQPGNPALLPVVCFGGRPAASDAYATPPSETTRLCCLNRTPFMLLPLINIFSFLLRPPSSSHGSCIPLEVRLSAVPQINARLDMSICLADEAASPCRMSLGHRPCMCCCSRSRGRHSPM